MKPIKQPVYKQIAEKLREELWRFKPGESFFSDRDIAKNFQVNVLTARRAVMQLVDSKQLERIPRKGTFVKDAPKSPKTAKAKRQSNRVDTYRFIHYLPTTSVVDIDPYFSSVYTNSMQQIRHMGGDLVFSSIMSADDLVLLPKVIRERGEQGVLLASLVGEKLCKQLKAIRGLQLIGIDCDYSHLGIDSVVWNLFEVGRQCAEHLLHAGHTHLAYIGMRVSNNVAAQKPELALLGQWPNAQQLYEGFKTGIADWERDHQVDIQFDFTKQPIEEVIEKLANADKRATGYFCFNGEHARRIAQFLDSTDPKHAAQYMSWSEPSQQPQTPIASITSRSNARVLSNVAIQALRYRIENPDSPVRIHSLLPQIIV